VSQDNGFGFGLRQHTPDVIEGKMLNRAFRIPGQEDDIQGKQVAWVLGKEVDNTKSGPPSPSSSPARGEEISRDL